MWYTQRNRKLTVRAILAVFLLVFSLSVMPVTLAQTDDSVPDVTQLFTDIYNQVSPSVVSINAIFEGSIGGTTIIPMPDAPEDGETPELPEIPEIPQFPEQIPQLGTGSGFVFDNLGHIVTNNHVVDGAQRIEVEFFDGTLARAEVVGLDPDSDLAVIKVDLPDEDLAALRPLEFGDSDALEVGQTVLAIGSPFGQRWTLTSGIISALDRTIPGLTQFNVGSVIQTDAAINPGNSGGPLLDLAGRVIGVNAQIRSETRSNSGVGFAIPGNLTRRVAQTLIDQGYMEYSFLGIRGGNVTLSIIEQFDLPNDFRGVVVSTVEAGTPADRAGLESAGETEMVDGIPVPTSVDIITAINSAPLRGIGDLISYLATNTQPGDTVTLSVLRDGTENVELDVRLVPR